MDVGGRVTQEQLPSDSDAAIYKPLMMLRKIAARSLCPLGTRNDINSSINQRFPKS